MLSGAPSRHVIFSSNLLLNTASDHDKLVDSVAQGNLIDDPSETTNLSAADPDRATAMQMRLHQWRKGVGAIMPSPR